MSDLYEKLSEAVIKGNIEGTKELTQQILDGGAEAQEVLDKGLLPGMDVVGQRFKSCEMFIPEVVRSAKSMHGAMDILSPLLTESGGNRMGKVVIGTVQGDLHDIGKNLVVMMLQGAGFQVVDLGTDVKPEAFAEAIKTHQPNILGMSALLTTTMPKMQETIDFLKEAGLRDQIKIMAGGAPVSQNFVEKIGADAYGNNASAAVDKAKEFLAGK
jgi:corrinoid protein of di/trimethylamine methyltransferase